MVHVAKSGAAGRVTLFEAADSAVYGVQSAAAFALKE